MSRSKATKRRRVWVVESVTGGLMLFASAKLAKKCAGGTKVTPMVERLPGDVVLSREEAANLRGWLTEIERNMWKPNPGLDGNRIARSIALLRGRR
jgi:hypothetical protein